MIGWIKKQIKQMQANMEENERKVSRESEVCFTISEPVLSFLEVFKKNPRRFKLSKADFISSRTYKLRDRVSGDLFWIIGHGYGTGRLTGPSWMTQDEIKLVMTTLISYYESRELKLIQTKDQRTRKRLMRIYCE